MWNRFLLLCFAVTVSCASAQKKPKPALPHIDRNACPFECCQFGTWKTKQQIQVFDNWTDVRKKSFTLKKGMAVTVLTGIHITYRPGRLRALRSIPDLHIRKGDVVLTYMYHGEGYFDFWVNGFTGNDQIYTSLKCSDLKKSETEPLCIEASSKTDWWVQIKTKEGRTGWVNGNEGFSGSDACGVNTFIK